MEQFVPADWCTSNMADAFAPSRGHVVMQSQPPQKPDRSMVQEHEAAPWFQYTVVFHDDRSLEKDLFSEIFGEIPAGSDSGSDSAPTPLRAREVNDALSYHDASATVTASSMRSKPPGAASRSSVRRKLSVSPGDVMQEVEESDSTADAVTTRGPAQRPTTGKRRRRAAQEHNLSERKRRDRINEKMRALQELVPHCNKTDKASMLDEAIEYLKSLQLRVQMMWTTGGSMAPAPAMFLASGAHPYMRRVASTRSRMPPFGDFRIH